MINICHLPVGSSLAEGPDDVQKSKRNFTLLCYCYRYACESMVGHMVFNHFLGLVVLCIFLPQKTSRIRIGLSPHEIEWMVFGPGDLGFIERDYFHCI